MSALHQVPFSLLTLNLQQRYDEFLCMTRQWQNLHLLKRAG
jgi:hypothetical protein